MLELPDSWVWDFWIADTGEEYHLFFLFASKALHDPDRRHRRASIGHARSTDLLDWKRLPDALVRSDAPAFDDIATWTGSIVQAAPDDWWIFYTGLSDAPIPDVQRIGAARSADLISWRKVDDLLITADPRWYSTAAEGDEPWRDPWVFTGADGLWHMLITARASGWTDPLDSGVLGHATSRDLKTWTVGPPLTSTGAGFGQLEVPQLIEVEGIGHLLIANCLDGELAPRRRGSHGGGIWAIPAAGELGPFDLERAALLMDATRYVGKAIRDRSNEWQLLAFRNMEGPGFVGIIADPEPLGPLLTHAFASSSGGVGSEIGNIVVPASRPIVTIP